MKINKIYLINPPSYGEDRLVREGRCMQRESSWSNLWMPLTICIIKALLQKEMNVKCKLRDAVADRFTMDDVKKEVKDFQPDVVVINTAVPSITGEDLDMAKLIKEVVPEAFITMMGVPATTMTDIIFKDERGKYVDVCVHHESEFPLLHLLQAIDKGEDWKQRKGLAYAKDGKVVYNEAYPPTDLDQLPEADFSDLNLDEYTLPFSRDRVAMIETSRGCPSNCTFCVGKEYYTRKFRFKEPEKIIDEMQCMIDKYNVRSFLFWADTWMLGGKRAEKVCDLIIDRGMDIKFLCNSRVDNAYTELLQKMKKAGCLVMAYGVESAVQSVLDNVKKNITVKQIADAIRKTNQAGVPNSAHVIVGLPGETWDTVKLTTKRLIKFNPTYINVYCPVPYPGTEMYDQAKEKGWLTSDNFGMYEELHAVMRNDDMTVQDMIAAKKYMIKKFYFRPRIFARELKRVIDERSLRRLYYLGVDGFNFMKGWALGGKHTQE